MQTWEEKILEREKGRAEGRTEGEQRLARLLRLLMDSEKSADMEKALNDPAYREQLYKEYSV